MTKEEIKSLAEKIVLGIATKEEMLEYNRLCDAAENIGREATAISSERVDAIEAELKENLLRKAGIAKVHYINWRRWSAVAASVLLVVALGWFTFFNNKSDTVVVEATEKKNDSIQYVQRHEINTSGQEKRIQLSDGTLILLANNSEISYREPFIGSRDISLNGKAYFKVAHDPSRPFTVTSAAIATTALGTEFTVTAYQNANYIIVRLYEGKVVIKAVDKNNKKMNDDVYLLPGQEYVYGELALKTLKVKKADPEQVMKQENVLDSPLLPGDVDEPWFMFNNQPLEKVLNDLAALNNVTIVYDSKDIRDVYFVAKYDKTEPLENILKRIATLNNLTVVEKVDTFILKK